MMKSWQPSLPANWAGLVLQTLAFLVVLIGAFVVTDRRITILEQNMIFMQQQFGDLKQAILKLEENQSLLVRLQTRTLRPSDLFDDPKDKGKR